MTFRRWWVLWSKKQRIIVEHFWKRIGRIILGRLINSLIRGDYIWAETWIVKRCQPCTAMEENQKIKVLEGPLYLEQSEAGRAVCNAVRSWRPLQTRVRSLHEHGLWKIWSFVLPTERPLALAVLREINYLD